MQTTILVSRFRDSLTPGAMPLVEEFDGEFRADLPRSPDLVSIHRDLLRAGRVLVIEWAWNTTSREYEQTAVTNVASLEHARQFVPPGAELRAVPEEFGLEAWVVS
jgi:hypothetical protein